MSTKIDEKIVEELRQSFQAFDKNGNGTICNKEIREFFKTLKVETSDTQINTMMKEVDVDDGGTLDFDEFLKLMSRNYERQNTTSEMRTIFETFDVDKSGKISLDELKHVLAGMGEKLTKKEVHEMIKFADEDGDSQVNYKEFLAMMEQQL